MRQLCKWQVLLVNQVCKLDLQKKPDFGQEVWLFGLLIPL